MTKKVIFISYSHKDKETADLYFKGFVELGYEVLSDRDILVGEDFTKAIFEKIRKADYFIVLLSPDYIGSNSAISEYNRIVGYSQTSGKIILPIVIRPTDLPSDLTGAIYVNALDKDVIKTLLVVKASLDKYEGKIESEKEKQKERIEKINISIADYIEPILKDLKSREDNLKTTSNIWNILGYISIIAGIGATITLVILDTKSQATTNLQNVLYLAIKGSILLVLLLTSSKYAFTLSKSYMNESLKNADKIHAISFGKFYIKAFEQTINPNDFKEIFQNWNYNRESSFSTISADNYDPKIVDAMTKIFDSIKDMSKKTNS